MNNIQYYYFKYLVFIVVIFTIYHRLADFRNYQSLIKLKILKPNLYYKEHVFKLLKIIYGKFIINFIHEIAVFTYEQRRYRFVFTTSFCSSISLLFSAEFIAKQLLLTYLVDNNLLFYDLWVNTKIIYPIYFKLFFLSELCVYHFSWFSK